MNRTIPTLAIALLLTAGTVASGCGAERTDPGNVLERALAPERLQRSVPGATVLVQSLGYEDRVLEERRVEVPASVLAGLRAALSDSKRGLLDLATGIEYEGTVEVGPDETDRVSGRLDPEALAAAIRASQGSAADRLGLPGRDLAESLVDARFDLYAGTADGVMRRLDLTLSLDDPDNALPPTRIRFSLTGESQLTSTS